MKKLGVLIVTLLLSLGLVTQTVAASQVTESTESTESSDSTESSSIETTGSLESSLESTESTDTTDSSETTNSSESSETSDFDQDLDLYISQISFERGLTLTRDDIEASLAYFEESIDNFTTVEELSAFLGEVIKADYSNLEGIYSDYDLDIDSLTQLLEENGEELSDYIYVQELNAAIYFYEEDVFERDPNFDQNLVTYLASVSAERGFEVTKDDIEGILSEYAMSTDDFENVEELSDFLGEVIKEDLSNLDYIYETYELDKETFLKLLSDNGKSLNDFVYISEIETFIWTTQYDNEYEAYMQQVSAFLDEIGLTQDELANLENYFLAMEDYLSSPEVTAELESIMERASAFLTLTEEPEPTEAQIKEIVSIYKDLLSLLKIDIKYTLIKDGKQTTLAIEDLVKLTEEDMKGVDIKISIYGEDGQLLADMLFTSEMLGTGDVTDVIEDTVNTIDKHINKNSNSTVKGGQLPTTASAYLPNALWGLSIVFAGILMYRKVRIVKGGSTKQQ